MKKLKIFPKMFIQIFSILGIIIILVHSLVYFIFPKTYLETRKEKIYNIADEISGNMNGKEIKYIEQTLELYSKSSEIKAFIKEKNNKNEIQIKNDINVNLESDSNSLIIEEREITLNDGKKINLQFVSTADMQKDAKDLSIKFLPYSLLISILQLRVRSVNGLSVADIDADVSVHPYGDAGDVGHRINRAFFGRHVEHGIGAGIPNTVGAVFDLSGVTIKPSVAFNESDAIGGAAAEPMLTNEFLVLADLFRELRYFCREYGFVQHLTVCPVYIAPFLCISLLCPLRKVNIVFCFGVDKL